MKVVVYVVIHRNQAVAAYTERRAAEERKNGFWDDCPDFDQSQVEISECEAEMEWGPPR